jgi:phytoene dehydrogenase-like protein
MSDAVVIGSGPNGLTAANLLAQRGWSVTVFEEQPEPGGAVRSGEITEPGFVHDLFSAFYPLGVASPVMRALELERHGLRWRRAPAVVAHPTVDGRCATLYRDLERTCESVGSFARGDAQGWRELYASWERGGDAFLESLFSPFPPVRGAAALARAFGPRELLDFVRMSLLSVRRLADERFEGAGAANLLAGNALHADLTPDSAGGGLFAWVLCMIGQDHGFPVPEGGAGKLTEALVRRLESHGGRVVCGAPVRGVIVRRGRAVGVRLDDGTEVPARRAVIADCGAAQLYCDLLESQHLPPRLLHDLRNRFQYDNSTVKLDWALSGRIPWTAEGARDAGTIHVADDMDALTQSTAELEAGKIPARPFLVMGQYAAADPTRAPEGAETAWAYTHVPQAVESDAGGSLTGAWTDAETEAFANRMEEQIERLAPGFRDLIVGRHIFSPASLERANANLVGGAINGGTAQIHQQLVFRPTPGLGRAETPVRRLYLGSSAAHPGGGVHGGCGSNAARAAVAHDRAGRFALAGFAGAAAAIGARTIKH